MSRSEGALLAGAQSPGASRDGASLPRVVVFSREDCCLCDEALAEIEKARESASFALEVVDVDADPELAARYGDEVPVIEIDGRKAFKYRVSRKELLRRLARPRGRV